MESPEHYFAWEEREMWPEICPFLVLSMYCVLISNKCSCNWSSFWCAVCANSPLYFCCFNVAFKTYSCILITTKCTLNFKPFVRLVCDLLVLLDNCNIFFQGFMTLMLHLQPPPCICQSRYSFWGIHQLQDTTQCISFSLYVVCKK